MKKIKGKWTTTQDFKKRTLKKIQIQIQIPHIQILHTCAYELLEIQFSIHKTVKTSTKFISQQKNQSKTHKFFALIESKTLRI